MRRLGVVYKLDDNRYGVAYNDKQLKEFIEKGKICLSVFYNSKCTVPVMKHENQQLIIFKSVDKIKAVGFIN